MTDEEKKALERIDYIQDFIIENGQYNADVNDMEYFSRIKNLIEKQSKEIEELKKPKYVINCETNEITKLTNDFVSIDKPIKQKDVTKRYENMIEAFECDFNLPFNYNDFTMFDDLKRLIQNKNKRLVKDIELLQELSFGIRYGNLKIIDKRNKLEGIIWN